MSKRIYALDVLRGVPIAIMLFLDAPPDDIFEILKHSPWAGLTVPDVALPAFAFAMGTSAAISFSRREPTTRRIFKRVAIMFAVGLFLNVWFKLLPFVFGEITVGQFFDGMTTHFRPFGVIQRLALAYLCAAFVVKVCRREVSILISAFALLIVSSAGYHLYAPENPFDEAHNLSGAVDMLIPGANHIYTPTHDPEGLYGTLSATASVLFGFLAGRVLLDNASKRDKIFLLATAGVALLIAGGLWTNFDIVSKKLWTSPFTLINAGGDLLLLALLLKILDGSSTAKKISRPFGALGTNPLFFYVMNNVALTMLFVIHVGDRSFYSQLYHQTTAGFVSTEVGATLFCVLWLLLWLPIAEIFYRRGIVIKI